MDIPIDRSDQWGLIILNGVSEDVFGKQTQGRCKGGGRSSLGSMNSSGGPQFVIYRPNSNRRSSTCCMITLENVEVIDQRVDVSCDPFVPGLRRVLAQSRDAAKARRVTEFN